MKSPHCLVTFLHVASGTPPVFRPATYDFGSGELRSDVHFGLALLEHLASRDEPPQRLIVLGTSGSSWGRLIAHVVTDADADRVATLDAASKADTASDDLLAPWAAAFAAALQPKLGNKTIEASFNVIGYAGDTDGQRGFTELMSRHVPDDARLTVDATHSLRHLALLGVFSAMTLRRLKSVAVAGIYYGALERTRGGRTPVWRLDGLPGIADWIAALGAYDKDGDYGVFTDLLVADGVPPAVAADLAEAAFQELMGNLNEARDLLDRFLSAYQRQPPTGTSSLFHAELVERLSWANEDRLYRRQKEMALRALARGDVMRAALWTQEAFTTRIAGEVGCSPLREDQRRVARVRFRERARYDVVATYDWLKHLRNRVAHADFGQNEVGNADDALRNRILSDIRDRKACLEALGRCASVLLGPRIDWRRE